MPQLSLIIFTADITPHLIHFNAGVLPANIRIILNFDNINHNLIMPVDRKKIVIHGLQFGAFFNSLMTVVGLISKTRAVSQIPLPLSVISTICCFVSDNRPLAE